MAAESAARAEVEANCLRDTVFFGSLVIAQRSYSPPAPQTNRRDRNPVAYRGPRGRAGARTAGFTLLDDRWRGLARRRTPAMAYSYNVQARSTGGGRRALVRTLKGTVVAAATMALTFSTLPCRAQDPEGLQGPPAPKAFDSRPLFDTPNGDGRRTMGAFPKNLGRNFVGVFSGQNLLPFAVGAAARFRPRRSTPGRGPPPGHLRAPAGGREPPREAPPWCRSSARCSWPAASPPRAASARPRTTSRRR